MCVCVFVRCCYDLVLKDCMWFVLCWRKVDCGMCLKTGWMVVPTDVFVLPSQEFGCD